MTQIAGMPTSARATELTAVTDRSVFEKLPGGVAEAARPRWEEFRDAYHRAHALGAPETFPLQIDFELNSTCQMKCAFCVHGQEVVKKREMSFELFAKVIEEGERYGLCSVKMNYINEPLLRKDLPRFIRFAKDHGVLNVYFATNGLLLTKEKARELIDAGLSKIMVSLDATTKETFSLMRRSTKLGEIEENIRGLLELRRELGVDYPAVRVNFLRAKMNAHEADAFVRKWEGVADTVGFQTQVRRPGVDDDLLGIAGEDPGTFRCSFPSKLLVVDSGGEILPCCTFSGRGLPLGNAADMTIAEAWKSTKIVELRRLHIAGQGAQNATCAHCIGC